MGESPEISTTLDLHANSIQDITRMPLMDISEKTGNAPFIGETEFTVPDDES